MPEPNDLTTLAAVQAWLLPAASPPPTPDPQGVIAGLIASASTVILGHLQRPSLLGQAWTDVSDGKDNQTAFLQNWPVLSVSQVTVDGQVIPPSPNGISYGWLLSPWDGYPPGNPQSVTILNSRYPRGRSNVSVAYKAGYVFTEAQVVPSGSPPQLTVSQSLGAWVADGGVTYANGTPFVLVASSPAVGQYSLGASPGQYQFNATDVGASILVSYSYVPWSIRSAATMLVGEYYRYQGRIGEKSRSLGGQTTASYDLSPIPERLLEMLNPYRKVLPI